MTPLVERWQGAGNVYLLVDARDLPQPLTAATASALAAECGGDGVLELSAGSGGADVTMRIWNPDGSESEACGNGTRMVARWVSERLEQADVSIATTAGVLPCHVDGTVIRSQLAYSICSASIAHAGTPEKEIPQRACSSRNILS